MLMLREVFALDVQGETQGKAALHYLLETLRFYHEALSDEDRYLQNAAKRILHDLGIWRDGQGSEIMVALGTIPPLYPEQIEESDDE